MDTSLPEHEVYADGHRPTAFSPAAARPHLTFLCSPREPLALLGSEDVTGNGTPAQKERFLLR